MGLQIGAKIFGRNRANRKEKGAFKEFVAKLSKGLMLPIAMLPIAGLFLGIGAAIATSGVNSDNEALKTFGNFLKVPGDVIFGALPVLFAIAIAIAFTGDAGPAALAAFVGFLVFSGLQSALTTPIIEGGKTIGYNLLFYNESVTVFNNGKPGLPTSLFGNVLGIQQLSSSVFGGLLVGFTVAFLYNKYKNIKLPPIIGFFSGIRFVPIVVFGAFFPITILFLILWPLFGIMLTYIGIGLGQAIGFNSFAFGFIERALVPLGLHHAFYSPLWYTNAGGSVDLNAAAIIEINGNSYALSKVSSATGNVLSWKNLILEFDSGAKVEDNVAGDQTMWAFFNSTLLGKDVYLYNFTQTSAANGTIQGATYGALATNEGDSGLHTILWSDLTSGFEALGTKGANGFDGVNIGQYLQGKYVFMIFGLPAAAAAMVVAAPKENRKMALSIVASAGFTSFLTGITEPIEFTFLFLAPWLFWGVHAFLCALAFGLMSWIGIILISSGHGEFAPHMGMSFSGGIIDWIIYGAIQIQYGSNAWIALLFGLAYVPIYYFVFLFCIKKFNIATPGRGDNTRLFTKADFLAKQARDSDLRPEQLMALSVVSAYGGFSNIKNVDACITKLRIQVDNQSIVDTDKLMALGAKGTMKPSPQSVYAVFGTEADIIKGNIRQLMEDLAKDPSLRDKFEKIMNSNEAPKAPTSNKTKEVVNTELANEKLVIKSPVEGKIVSLEKVPDETFSKGLMGKGIAIEPSNGKFFSPIDGKMSLVFDTGHAYTFESEKGTQVLMHIGIDSINLKDKSGNEIKPFTPKVNTGDSVKNGDPISEVKMTGLKHAKSTITPIIVLDESLAGREIKILKKSGEVKKGTPIFEVLPKKEK